MKTLLWHASMIPDFLLHYWPVTLAIIITIGVGLYLWVKHSPRPKLSTAKLFSVLSFSLAVLLLGAIFAAGPNAEQQQFAGLVTYFIAALVLFQILFSIYIAKSSDAGARVLSSGFLLLALAITLSASFVATMSITGDWL